MFFVEHCGLPIIDAAQSGSTFTYWLVSDWGIFKPWFSNQTNFFFNSGYNKIICVGFL